MIEIACKFLDREYAKAKAALIALRNIRETAHTLLTSPKAVRSNDDPYHNKYLAGFENLLRKVWCYDNTAEALSAYTKRAEGVALECTTLGKFLRFTVLEGTCLCNGEKADTFKEWLSFGWRLEKFNEYYPKHLKHNGSVRDLLLYIKDYFHRINLEYSALVDVALPLIQTYFNDCLAEIERKEAVKDDIFANAFGAANVAKLVKVEIIVTEG